MKMIALLLQKMKALLEVETAKITEEKLKLGAMQVQAKTRKRRRL